MKTRILLPLLALSLIFTVVASADVILIDRGLPTAANGANNTTTALRSNVNWQNQGGGVAYGGFINGDSFTATGGDWTVNTITMWVALNNTSGAITDEFTSFTLYGGLDTDPTIAPIAILAAASAVSDTYPGTSGCTGYLGADNTSCYSIYKLVFTLSSPLSLANGQTYDFALDGTTKSASYYTYILATNAALGYGNANYAGSDGSYLNWDATVLAAGPIAIDSGASNCGGGTDSCGWDKSSDMNVVVAGSSVPEPSTIGLLAFGLIGLGWKLRRK